MNTTLVESAPAKINLTLRVLGRRPDGYHDLESLVAFAEVGDTLALRPGPETTLAISGPFAAACGPIGDNLVLKAAKALAARVSGLVAGNFALEKNLPAAAGMGGGSADAAAALRLLARANGMAVDDPRLSAAAAAVGADVPVCVDPRPRIMRGLGERLSPPVGLPRMPAVLVNPGVAVETRAVFGKLAATKPAENDKKPLGDVPRERDAIVPFLDAHGNDLTAPAIACAPVIAEVLMALRAMPAVRLARMSGSGATCFALFPTADDAEAAARCLVADRPNWWVAATTLG